MGKVLRLPTIVKVGLCRKSLGGTAYAHGFRLPFDVGPTCGASYSSFSHRQQRAFCFCSVVIFTSALVGGPVKYFHMPDVAIAHAVSGIFLVLRAGMYAL